MSIDTQHPLVRQHRTDRKTSDNFLTIEAKQKVKQNVPPKVNIGVI